MPSAAAKPAPKLVALSPTEVEELAAEYRGIEAKMVAIEIEANEKLKPLTSRNDQIWDVLVAQVRKFGSQHAEKSKLLHGLALEVMVTFGSSSTIDAADVELFRLALVKAKQS